MGSPGMSLTHSQAGVGYWVTIVGATRVISGGVGS